MMAGRHLLRRIVQLAAISVAATFAVTVMMSLPAGDPARVLAGPDASDEQVEAVRVALRLDRPILERYGEWLWNAIAGDLGDSLRTGRPVIEAIGQRLPVTLELLVLAQLVALLYAVPVGVYAAYRAGRTPDTASTVASFLMFSIPSFVFALLAIRLFAVHLDWFPTGGWTSLSDGVVANLRSAALPVLALAIEPAGIYQRLVRGDMRRTLDEDFVMMAEAKGLRSRAVLFRHSLRPSSLTLLTMTGIVTARMVGGSVAVETIFGLPGLGRLVIDAIGARDFVTLQGAVAVMAVSYVVINAVVDVLYGVIDPRVRLDVAR